MDRQPSTRWNIRLISLSCALMLMSSNLQVQAQTRVPGEEKVISIKPDGATPKPDSSRPKPPPLYDTKADAHEQIAKATAKAKRDGSRVLVMFGFNTCGWCHKLHDLFKSDPEIRKVLFNEFVTAMVDIEAPNADDLLKKCKQALSKEEQEKGVGFPFLAVLDASGNVIKAQRTDPLEVGNHHDPKKVLDFLKQNMVEPREAKKVYKSAIAQASSQDKQVFLHFGAPWCGWCHHLEDFLAIDEITRLMGKEFVDVKIDTDRMIGGEALLTELRGNESGGIPWFAILDPTGKVLATSDGPKGNIGYPAQPEEIDHFISILRKTARKLEPAQIDQIKTTLQKEAVRLKIRPAQ